MTTTTPTTTTPTTTRGCDPATAVTRSLLGWGAVAGPFYVAVSLAQASTRDGFDLTRHPWSLLENGSLGWIQSANFVLTGAMVAAFAVGLARAGAGRWAPRLLALYGAGLAAAGVFTADPMAGFPVGTPAGPAQAPSWHGTLHLAAGGIGFLAMIAACLVLGRRFAAGGLPGWALASRVTGSRSWPRSPASPPARRRPRCRSPPASSCPSAGSPRWPSTPTATPEPPPG